MNIETYVVSVGVWQIALSKPRRVHTFTYEWISFQYSVGLFLLYHTIIFLLMLPLNPLYTITICTSFALTCSVR